MSTARVNGVNLYYEHQGSGYPLVLISGYTTDVSAWALVRQALANHYSVFMFDNRGSGRSDCLDHAFTIGDMAEDTRAFIESLNLDRPHLLGHSMGGAIAQSVAHGYPSVINKLILANTFIKLREVSTFSMKYLFKLRSQGMPLVTMFEGSMSWLFSNEFLKNEKQVSQIMKIVEEYPFSQSVIGQKRQLEAMLQFSSESWYKTISVPTLIIEGSADIVCPYDSQRLASGIAGAQLVTLAGQGHMAHVETPHEFVKPILHFLNEQ